MQIVSFVLYGPTMGMNSKYDRNLMTYTLKNSYTPYIWRGTPMNLRPITIKTNPQNKAIDPFIFFAKNIIVSDNAVKE